MTDLVAAATAALSILEHLTTEEFARGGDRPARVALARAIWDAGELDAESAREYGCV